MKLKKGDDLYTKVTQHITKVREQGESPKSDLFALDAYVCDLCKGTASKEDITQCAFCGRWVCRKNCWNTEHMACTTCVGVIKLCKESVDVDTERTKIISNSKKESVKKTKKSKPKGKFKSLLGK
jgi:hypothetical protein